MNAYFTKFALICLAISPTASPPASRTKRKQQDLPPNAPCACGADIGGGGPISGTAGWVRCPRN
jgi:hypothetical protein